MRLLDKLINIFSVYSLFKHQAPLLCLAFFILLFASSACANLALPVTPSLKDFTTLAYPEATLQPRPVISLSVIGATANTSTQRQAALLWIDKDALAHDGEWPIHIGLFNSDQNQVASTGSTIDIRTSSGAYVQWSPDSSQLLLHGWSVLAGYYDIDVLSIAANGNGSSRIVLNKVCCGVHCDWGPDSRYLVCDTNTSHGEPPSLIVYDAKSLDRLCINDDFHSSRCPPLRLSDGRWWHIVGAFGKTIITDSPDTPPENLKRMLPPTPDNSTLTMRAICEAYPEKCTNFSISPDHRFIAIQSKAGLFIWNIEQRKVWNATGAHPVTMKWSTDSRYLAWLDQKQLWIFDTNSQSAQPYIVPNAEIIEFEWSPQR